MFSWTKWKKYFPLTSINDIVNLFEEILSSNEPNLIFVSIVLGLIEKRLVKYSENEENHLQDQENAVIEGYADAKLFTISINEIMPLYKTFITFISDISNFKQGNKKNVDRNILKSITDHIFQKLSIGKHKEMCHSQSIYSFVIDNSLDSFGLAYTVVAVSQYMGYTNTRLSLSEDHAWVEYDIEEVNNNSCSSIGEEPVQKCTADVAWTGKDEDKRCSSIEAGILDRSRLYLRGNCVVCAENTTIIAAAITTINPVKSSHVSLNFYSNRSNSSYHSFELACLKRDLLWLCYNKGLLATYPLALINLADLERNYPQNRTDLPDNDEVEEASVTKGTNSTALALYKEAVDINMRQYDNCHVYPYLSMANYFYHVEDYVRAMKCWRLAACVISNYNYKSEDWVIYREFFDIATHYIPSIFRTMQHKEDDLMSEFSGSHGQDGNSRKTKSVDRNDYRIPSDLIRTDMEFLVEFLCYFDYICLWEEGSSVPVLHEVWANKFKEALCRFAEDTRVELGKVGADERILDCALPIEEILDFTGGMVHSLSVEKQAFAEDIKKIKPEKHSPNAKRKHQLSKVKKSPGSGDDQISEFWSAFGNTETNRLSSILSSRVLNIDFLLNTNNSMVYDIACKIEPIDYEKLHCAQLCQLDLEQRFIDYFAVFKDVKEIFCEANLNSHFNGAVKPAAMEQVLQDLSQQQSHVDPEDVQQMSQQQEEPPPSPVRVPLAVVFKSQKMRDISGLVTAPGKLNIPAIKLPLTAQSQVSLKRTGLQSVYGSHNHDYSICSRKRFKKT